MAQAHNNNNINNNNNGINIGGAAGVGGRGGLAQPPANFENLFFNGNFAEDSEHETIPSAHNINRNRRANEPTCWIFGYGSLCWLPGFTYSKCITGYIRGYIRRFWQGNVTHRGTEQRPGRVATLVEEKEGITWGCAYRITGQTALEYLKQRECTLGGYATLETKFFPRVASHGSPFTGETVEVLVYIATPDNPHWLGEDTTKNLAQQIVDSRGPSGHNAEYLLRLAQFMHDEIPGVVDEHLFDLERLVIEELRKRNIPLSTVMGTNPDRIRRDSHEDIRRPSSFEFTSRVTDTKLRCLNI